MNDTNPQIENLLNRLAEICCQSLDREQAANDAETESLLKSLLMSGYVRKSDTSLRTELEDRIKDRRLATVMHRGGELSGLTGKLQEKFDELVRWQSKQPESREAAKAANISSATNA